VLAPPLFEARRAVCARQGMWMWADGLRHLPLLAMAQLPSTRHGRAQHHVAHAKASFAAASIAAGLSRFSSSENQNPLRLNLYRSHWVTRIVDRAHSASA